MSRTKHRWQQSPGNRKFQEQVLNKVILTGHSQGLGAALAAALLTRGDQVLALSRSGNPELAKAFGANLAEHSIDLSDMGALSDWLAGDGISRFLDGAKTAVLINNAGVVSPIGPPGRQGAAQISQAVALNVAAPLMLSDALLQVTDPRGESGGPERRIMHISSGAARSAYSGWSIYCATKAALDHHARSVVEDNIAALRIESLAPGVIDTQMQAQIRSTGVDRFPARERFEAMKREGALASAEASAAIIAAHLFSDQFGRVTTTDVRQLG